MDNTPLSSCNETNSVVLCVIVSMPFFVVTSHCIYGVTLLNYSHDIKKYKYYK